MTNSLWCWWSVFLYFYRWFKANLEFERDDFTICSVDLMSLSSTSCIALLVESCVTCLWISVIDNQSCCIEVLLSIMTFYLKTSIHLLHLFNLHTFHLSISYSSLTSLIFFSFNSLLNIKIWLLELCKLCLFVLCVFFSLYLILFF